MPSGQNNTPSGRCCVAEETGAEENFFVIGLKGFGKPVAAASLLRARLSVLINIPRGRFKDALGIGLGRGKLNGFIFSFIGNDFEFAAGRDLSNPIDLLSRTPSGGGV